MCSLYSGIVTVLCVWWTETLWVRVRATGWGPKLISEAIISEAPSVAFCGVLKAHAWNTQYYWLNEWFRALDIPSLCQNVYVCIKPYMRTCSLVILIKCHQKATNQKTCIIFSGFSQFHNVFIKPVCGNNHLIWLVTSRDLSSCSKYRISEPHTAVIKEHRIVSTLSVDCCYCVPQGGYRTVNALQNFINNYHTKDANRDKKIYMLSMLFKSCTSNFFPAVEAAFPRTKVECGCPPVVAADTR